MDSPYNAQRVTKVDVDEGSIDIFTADKLPSTTIGYTRPSGSGAIKRKTGDTENDDEVIGAIRSRKRPATQNNRPRVGCPFYKNCPDLHHDKMSCRGTGFAEMGKLKDHLKDIHQVSKQTLDDLNFRSRKFTTLGTIEEKWRRVYLILFPDTEEHCIPISNSEPPHSSTDLARLQSIFKKKIFANYGESIRNFIPDLAANFDTLFHESTRAVQNSPYENSPTTVLSQTIDYYAPPKATAGQLPTPDTTPQLGRETTPTCCFPSLFGDDSIAENEVTGLYKPDPLDTLLLGHEVMPVKVTTDPEHSFVESHHDPFCGSQLEINPSSMTPPNSEDVNNSMYLSSLPELPITTGAAVVSNYELEIDDWDSWIEDCDFSLFPLTDTDTASV